MKINEFLAGKCSIEASAEHAVEIMNILLATQTVYRRLCVKEESVSFETSHGAAKKLSEICRHQGIELSVTSCGGLPHVWKNYRSRLGLWLGLAAAVVILVWGSGVLWQVRVEGNETLSDGEVCTLLAEYGVCVGADISKIDTDTVRALVEKDSDNIAWLAINIRGTVAEVQVREEHAPDAYKEAEGDGVNLVADRDAMILGYELTAGEAVAPVGTTVKAGELLVSGLLESRRFGWRAVRAEGRVWAQTQRSYTVSIPYEYTVSTPVEREILEISLIFFSKEQKLFKNSGNCIDNCDKIKSVTYVYSSDEHTVPFGISTVSRLVTKETKAVRSVAEAREAAYFELNRLISAEGDGVRIVQKKITEIEGEAAFTLECALVCTEDIARPVAFYMQDADEKG
jgi:similar to stage IV sporulation protein